MSAARDFSQYAHLGDAMLDPEPLAQWEIDRGREFSKWEPDASKAALALRDVGRYGLNARDCMYWREYRIPRDDDHAKRCRELGRAFATDEQVEAAIVAARCALASEVAAQEGYVIGSGEGCSWLTPRRSAEVFWWSFEHALAVQLGRIVGCRCNWCVPPSLRA